MAPACLDVDRRRQIERDGLLVLANHMGVALADRDSIHERWDVGCFHNDLSPYIMDTAGSTLVQRIGNDFVHVEAYTRRMDTKRPPHYLREWRKHAGLTQEQLAEAVGTSKSQISELERYNLQLSPKWLARLAPVLKVQQGYIIDHDPADLDNDIIEIWARIPERDREQAARVLRSFTRTGTDD